MKCRVCGVEIPEARLAAIKGCDTCVQHSSATKLTGFMVGTASKGCAAELVLIPNDKESQRMANRAHRRSR